MEIFINTLEKIDPADWHNIPECLVNSILALKSCVKIQFENIEKVTQQFVGLEGKNNKKFVSFKESLDEREKYLKDGLETSKLSMKKVENRVRVEMSELRQKIVAEMQVESANLEYKLKEFQGEMKEMKRVVGKIVSLEEIREDVDGKICVASEKIRKDVQETVVVPEIYNVYQKIYMVEG